MTQAKTEDSFFPENQTDLLLMDLLQKYAYHWKAYAVTAVMAVILSVLWLVAATPKYTAVAVIARPLSQLDHTAGSKPSFGLGSTLAQSVLGNFRGEDGLMRFREMLFSVRTGEELLREKAISTIIFHREWNPGDETWQKPTGLAASVKLGVKDFMKNGKWRPPSGLRLSSYLRENISIRKGSEIETLTITYQHHDPDFALKMVTNLIETTDTLMRQGAARQNAVQRDFLDKTISETTDTATRQMLTGLMVQKLEESMFLSGDLPYIAEFIDNAYVTEYPTSPSPFRVLTIWFILLMLIVSAYVTRVEVFPGRFSKSA